MDIECTECFGNPVGYSVDCFGNETVTECPTCNGTGSIEIEIDEAQEQAA